MADGTQQSDTIHIFRVDERSGARTASGVQRQGTEAVQRATNVAGEVMRQSAQVLAEGQRQFAQDTAERFADVSQKVAQAVQGTTDDLRSLMVMPNAARGGLQDLQQGVTGLVEGMVRTNVRATQELFRLYNPATVIELQQRFAREYLEAFMQGTATLVRAARRTADETLQPLEQQVARRRQARQDEQSYQHAAE